MFLFFLRRSLFPSSSTPSPSSSPHKFKWPENDIVKWARSSAGRERQTHTAIIITFWMTNETWIRTKDGNLMWTGKQWLWSYPCLLCIHFSPGRGHTISRGSAIRGGSSIKSTAKRRKKRRMCRRRSQLWAYTIAQWQNNNETKKWRSEKLLVKSDCWNQDAAKNGWMIDFYHISHSLRYVFLCFSCSLNCLHRR